MKEVVLKARSVLPVPFRLVIAISLAEPGESVKLLIVSEKPADTLRPVYVNSPPLRVKEGWEVKSPLTVVFNVPPLTMTAVDALKPAARVRAPAFTVVEPV